MWLQQVCAIWYEKNASAWQRMLFIQGANQFRNHFFSFGITLNYDELIWIISDLKYESNSLQNTNSKFQ